MKKSGRNLDEVCQIAINLFPKLKSADEAQLRVYTGSQFNCDDVRPGVFYSTAICLTEILNEDL